jgi:cytochrome c oxidase subunit 2
MTERRRGRGRRFVAVPTLVAGAAFGLLAACSGASDNQPSVRAPGGDSQSTLHPKGRDAREIMNLFTPFFWIGVAIGVAVLVAVVYVAVRFRARGDDERPKQIHGHTGLEIGWTIIPALLLAVMAVPTVAVIFDLAEKPAAADTVHINVIGHQWWWEYDYADAGFKTANEMRIPAGVPVSLDITSADVIHSFWIPNLAGKKDAVPGRHHFLRVQADEPGEFLGQCAEYCGLSHANMRLRVVALPRAEYDQWVAQQQKELTESQKRFVDSKLGTAYGCTSCHSFEANGSVNIGPNLTHLADRSTFAGAMFELDRANLRKWVHDAPSMKPMQTSCPPGAAPCTPGSVPGMKSFKNEMTQQDLDEIVDFLLTLK